MSEFSSSIDGSNKIIVPFEFKLGNLENLQNILEKLHKAAQDLPPEAREGMGIPRKGGGGTPSTLTAAQQRKATKVLNEHHRWLFTKKHIENFFVSHRGTTQITSCSYVL